MDYTIEKQENILQEKQKEKSIINREGNIRNLGRDNSFD